MFIHDLITALHAQEVRYCLVGGVAVNLHGVPRMTYDVDIVVEMDATNLAAVDSVLSSLGLRCRLPLRLVDLHDAETRRRYFEERNLLAVTYTNPNDGLQEVDVLVAPPISATELVRDATELKLGELPVRVASIEHVLAMKRASGRAQDLADIAHLDRVRKGSV
ncbi:MAG: nucleotidyl transferase AbiEii/AbiGii toxin family protein [Polyangiaceae bacterium]|nr:nucleotidyl transferase AbiEii/AbiGii toxin family protein [Polyangiaceae bacterium]